MFDLDGVLVDSKDVHFKALNQALEEIAPRFVIGHEAHVRTFDGLPTATKLSLLSEQGLSKELHWSISKRKQEITRELLVSSVSRDEAKVAMVKDLKARGFKVHVASNAVRSTVEAILSGLGIISDLDYVISNEDVCNPKPHPEMYMRCMLKEGVGPRDTLIAEDSAVGRQAVFDSGAYLCPVNSPKEVTIEKVNAVLDELGTKKHRLAWKDDKLNVLIPMAGAGSRFSQAGYKNPKPLIDVNGKPMIQVVIENLNIDAHYIFIVQNEHYDKFNLQYLLGAIAPGCDIIGIDGVTEGAACTTLLAKKLINSDKQLLIANADQWVDWDSSDFMYAMQSPNVDGGILTFHSTHPKWSYVRVNDVGVITEVREKQPISNDASVGIYYWKKGKDYVRYAEQMIAKDIRVNNEFYVAPVYNEAFEDDNIVRAYRVNKMMGLGTPADLDEFLASNKK